MALFATSSLNPGVAKREVFGWAMYDFANSGYTTVVLTAVFNAYFVGVVAGNAELGDAGLDAARWRCRALIVMFTMPTLGAYADLRAAKKRLLVLTHRRLRAGHGAAGAGRAGRPVAGGGRDRACPTSVYAYGESLIAAFLPELARREALGRVSGWGWSFGYFGGMLTLGLSLGYVLWAQGQGMPATQFVPVTMLITAGGLCAGVAGHLRAAEGARACRRRAAAPASGLRASLRRLAQTWREARRYQDFVWLLACAVAYQAGIAVVIALAAVYAEQVLGFKQTQTMMLIFLVNIAAAIGAFGFGYWQDRIGHRPALAVTLVGLDRDDGAGLRWPRRPALFWVAAVVAGLCMGSSQSAGRAMAGAVRARRRSGPSSSACGPSRRGCRRSSGR